MLTPRLAPVVVLYKTGVTLCICEMRFWLPSELVEAGLLIALLKGWLLIVLVEAWLPIAVEEV